MGFDPTDQRSFYIVKQWLPEIRRELHENTNIILVGCKCDLATRRVVTVEAVAEFIKACKTSEYKIDAYIETSAKDNINLGLVFEMAARIVLKHIALQIVKPKSVTQLHQLCHGPVLLVNCSY